MSNFTNLIREILLEHPEGMTPQEIREIIKQSYPEYYGTDSHKRNVEKKHYKDIDHALLAQIYLISRSAGNITADKSQKPIRLSLSPESDTASGLHEEEIDTENLERLEADLGTLYVLGTNLFTKDGDEIIKIGITSGNVNNRIAQLYTTGVPYRFRVITQHETKNYAELEHACHKLLDPFRLNQSREFFSAKCLPHVYQIVSLHKNILNVK